MTKYRLHPLTRLFLARCFSPVTGMNWLQERGLVSDCCVTVEDVAPCDVARVVALFAARWGGVRA